MPTPHKYIIFSGNPYKGANTEVATMLIQLFFQNRQSIQKWRKDKKLYSIAWTARSEQKKSHSINYLLISQFIRENGYFNPAHFNLPPIECFWLDHSLDYKINWHNSNGLFIADGVSRQQYGEKYPVVPILNREEHSFTTLQPQLLDRILQERNKLIENSDKALETSWFFNLRTLISDAASIIEITLNQIYIKAEYDPLPHWTFNKQALGQKYGRRFEDKLKWIYKISGNNINAETYMDGVNNLKKLRNHMMHFDPPSLVITIEEAAVWLNQVIDVGYLLIKIRKAIGAEVSLQLMNFILQKTAIFSPEAGFKERRPLNEGEGGYSSSTW